MSRINKKLFFATLAALLGLGLTSYAGGNKQPSQPKEPGAPQARIAPADRQFVVEAAQGSIAEVELGKLAQQKGAAEPTREYGQMMVEHHGKLHEQLRQFAERSKIKLPDKPGPKHARVMATLRKAQGQRFDMAYAKAMVEDHQQDIMDFERQQKMTRNAELKQLISDALPTLRTHVAQAQKLQQRVSGVAGR